jgi:hypothetical protein
MPSTSWLYGHVDKTVINTWAGTGYIDYQRTFWVANVATGESFYHPASGLTIRQLQVTADSSAAVVSICRNSSTSETPETCSNGLDDDCDGLIDAADPDCGAVSPLSSPPPASPPPPPTAGDPQHAADTCTLNRYCRVIK